MKSIRENRNAINETLRKLGGYTAQELADKIMAAESWEKCELECEELCYRANLLTAWKNAVKDDSKCVIVAAALNLEIELEYEVNTQYI